MAEQKPLVNSDSTGLTGRIASGDSLYVGGGNWTNNTAPTAGTDYLLATTAAGGQSRVDVGLVGGAGGMNCMLEWRTGGNVFLVPCRGDSVLISGVPRKVSGSGGVGLGTSVSTVYHIYAYWTGSAVQLVTETVYAPVWNATYGYLVASYGAQYTYVGSMRPDVAAAVPQAGLRSMYNGGTVIYSATNTATGTITWDGGLHTMVTGGMLVLPGDCVDINFMVQIMPTQAIDAAMDANINWGSSAKVKYDRHSWPGSTTYQWHTFNVTYTDQQTGLASPPVPQWFSAVGVCHAIATDTGKVWQPNNNTNITVAAKPRF